MFGPNGAAQTRVMQQQALPPQPPVPPLSSAQPTLCAQVPQLLTPQVQIAPIISNSIVPTSVTKSNGIYLHI